jgi:hypothetical protein
MILELVMPRPPFWPPVAAMAVLALMPSSASAQRPYIAPTHQTVVSETEEAGRDVVEQVIYLHNRSTERVRVFSVTLSQCRNVRQRCGRSRMNIAIEPGHRRAIFRVNPANSIHAFSYFYTVDWRPDVAKAVTSVQPADIQEQSGERHSELTLDDFKRFAGRAVSLRAEPESLMLVPGEEARIESIRVLIVDAQGEMLGHTRWLQWAFPGDGPVEFHPDRLVARQPGRIAVRFRLADDARNLLGTPVKEIEVPVVVAYRVEANAPVFAGRAVDGETGRPLGCARVSLEDTLHNAASSGRTDAAGLFQLQAPAAGSYRVRFDVHGWAPVFGPMVVAAAEEWKESQYRVSFTEQVLTPRYLRATGDFEHAQPAAVRTEPITMRSAPGKATTTPIVTGVTLGGSESMPILGIISRVPAMTMWMQFVVDSAGRVDTASVVLPPEAPANARAGVMSVLPRVRFSPAREAGKATCELVRMQVNFSPR